MAEGLINQRMYYISKQIREDWGWEVTTSSMPFSWKEVRLSGLDAYLHDNHDELYRDHYCSCMANRYSQLFLFFSSAKSSLLKASLNCSQSTCSPGYKRTFTWYFSDLWLSKEHSSLGLKRKVTSLSWFSSRQSYDRVGCAVKSILVSWLSFNLIWERRRSD